MASERLSGDERELLYAIAQQATALAGGTMNTEAHDERELLAEIELQLRTLVEGGVPSGSSLSAGQVPQWNGSQFVGLFVDSWDFGGGDGGVVKRKRKAEWVNLRDVKNENLDH